MEDVNIWESLQKVCIGPSLVVKVERIQCQR